MPHAHHRDTCPAFISQSSTIVKAASPSIRRTRSPSAGAPPQAGPIRHADRGTRAAPLREPRFFAMFHRGLRRFNLVTARVFSAVQCDGSASLLP
nr:hypothetical protein [Burkholderia sp. Ac-20345]